ncbi:cell division protein FtsQ/DivIB [Solirubrobacter soli]|uniref:cell division protein FtsQ/DivIB n=1 Tax=Solirubrobacter soli TaxID=363832 RepID=UPI001B7FA21F|nr:FtsQ-type POTRA domain-containing protein [Solirubrobacter soli]
MTVTRRGRRLLRLAFGLIVLAAALSAGWMWLRDSSLVEVRDVQITGVTASDGEQVKTALETAAMEMTTLHVRPQALRDATANLSSVKSLEVTKDFPHTLRIHVNERRPVAALAPKGEDRIPVTGDGVVMTGVTADRDLPSLVVADSAISSKLTDKRALRALTIAGAAPDELLRKVSALAVNKQGVVASLKNGPELVFGTDADAHAKWVAAARVLAESSAAGATYLDLRIPGRVAAGGLAPVEPAGTDPNAPPEGENSPTLNGG